MAFGSKGVYVQYDKQQSPKMLSWDSMYSLEYKKNSFHIKLNSVRVVSYWVKAVAYKLQGRVKFLNFVIKHFKSVSLETNYRIIK